ncbi:MAG: EthD family reductase [Chryseobacterium sp.]|nr:EthD family reductase [Chryseobacterium sp.]
MIKVSIYYRNGKDAKFDADYYKNSHLPMISEKVGDALKGLELDLGIGGRKDGEPAPYIAIAHLKFDDVASFKSSFGPYAELFAADVKNYTNLLGELQISEIITF